MFLLTSASILIPLILVAATETHASKECEAHKEESWSYRGANGPRFWGKRYPACYGMNQSPIDIDTNEVVQDTTLGEISTSNYDVPVSSANITNNGHTIQLTPTDRVVRSIKDGGLHGQWNLTQMHCHWGSQPTRGSEHRVNGRRYAMECHLVHVNNNSEIAVLGVLFEERNNNNPHLGPFVTALNNTRYKDDQTTLQSPLNLKDMLPNSLDNFYRYSGSLTTPGCAEGVTWTVFAETKDIGNPQMQVMRNLNSTRRSESHACLLVDNYRPVQKLNGRQVTAARKDW